MYAFDQIIFDKDNKRPVIIHDVWDRSEYPKRHTHLVDTNGKIWGGPEKFEDEAEEQDWLRRAAEMLAHGEIVPAKTPDSHCDDCGNWLTNKPASWCQDTKHMDVARQYVTVITEVVVKAP